jgi:hypothetical protein
MNEQQLRINVRLNDQRWGFQDEKFD